MDFDEHAANVFLKRIQPPSKPQVINRKSVEYRFAPNDAVLGF